MDITYQQILAEQYDENAKMLLVQQEHEYDYEMVKANHEDLYSDNELEDKEEFNKFHGDRNKPEHVIKPKPDPDSKHRDNIRVLNQIVNIDTKFRGNIVPITPPPLCSGAQPENTLLSGTSSSWFVYAPDRPYKNVKSVKITSIEFPNTFYTFSKSTRNNTILSVQTIGGVATPPIKIDDGNYTPAELVTDIQSKLPAGYTIALGPRSNKITITGQSGFTLSFPSTPNLNPNGNGIGYNLGFLQQTYTTTSSNYNPTTFTYTADTVPDTIQDHYIYIVINDYNLIKHPVYGQTSIQAFGKITLPGVKNTIVFDNNYTNSSSKIYHFQQPTNVTKFEVKFIDAYGNVLDLNGANTSITLELQEVLDSSIYENMLML